VFGKLERVFLRYLLGGENMYMDMRGTMEDNRPNIRSEQRRIELEIKFLDADHILLNWINHAVGKETSILYKQVKKE